MANVATALTPIPALFRGQQPTGKITPVVVSFDTIGADLTVYTPAAGSYAAVVGIRYSEASAHSLVWKSPAATTLLTEEKTTFASEKERIGRPIVIGQRGEPLLLRCETAPVSSMIIYIAELSRIELMSL